VDKPPHSTTFTVGLGGTAARCCAVAAVLASLLAGGGALRGQELAYQFRPGDRHRYLTVTRSSSWLAGEDGRVQVEHHDRRWVRWEVVEVDEDEALIEMRFEAVHLERRFSGSDGDEDVEVVDSRETELPSSIGLDSLWDLALVDQPLHLRIDRTGRVSSIESPDALAGVEAALQGLRGQTGAEGPLTEAERSRLAERRTALLDVSQHQFLPILSGAGPAETPTWEAVIERETPFGARMVHTHRYRVQREQPDGEVEVAYTADTRLEPSPLLAFYLVLDHFDSRGRFVFDTREGVLLETEHRIDVGLLLRGPDSSPYSWRPGEMGSVTTTTRLDGDGGSEGAPP
jgi:hypothetical protein